MVGGVQRMQVSVIYRTSVLVCVSNLLDDESKKKSADRRWPSADFHFSEAIFLIRAGHCLRFNGDSHHACHLREGRAVFDVFSISHNAVFALTGIRPFLAGSLIRPNA